jgi:hypothetical protein
MYVKIGISYINIGIYKGIILNIENEKVISVIWPWIINWCLFLIIKWITLTSHLLSVYAENFIISLRNIIYSFFLVLNYN